MSLEKRFWAKVNYNGPVHPVLKTKCWLWTAARDRDGYGRFGTGGSKVAYAHRVAWLLTHGAWPKPQGLHKCDNPPCVRPDHLFEGAPKENNLDMCKKGRHGKPDLAGTKNPRAKLTEKQVLTIRKMRGTNTLSTIAKKFGIGISTVFDIVKLHHWKAVAVVCVLTGCLHAQSSSFWSKERKAETTGLVAESITDGITTQMWLGASPKHTELNPLARPLVTRGNAGQVAACVLGVGAVLGIEYALWKTGHHKASRHAGRIAVVAEGLNVGRQIKLVTQ